MIKRSLSRFLGNLKRWTDVSIVTRVIVSFLLIIIMTSAVSILVGIKIINDRIVGEAQERVRNDMNSAHVLYNARLNQINDVVRLTAARVIIIDAFLQDDWRAASAELAKVLLSEGLDILTVTDVNGTVILRTRNKIFAGDYEGDDDLIEMVKLSRLNVASTEIVPREELLKESSTLIKQAKLQIIDTPLSRPSEVLEITSGMMLKAAAPVFDAQGNMLGILYGGELLNGTFDIVDEIKQTVFQNVKYKNKDIGTATIFQNDVRISTNVFTTDGERAIGTRVSEEVFNQVVLRGEPYIGRAYVVNNWYITAYEPIHNIHDEVIGILYVGLLEQKYVDIQRETIIAFLSIAGLSMVVAIMSSLAISRTISNPLSKLVHASRALAQGDFDVKVENTSNNEFGELSRIFNLVTQSLKERDEKLKEYTKSKIMESERLALIGQLAANVAHELNNPLVGIVTYSHLLLEKLPPGDPSRDGLEKIVTQANRSRDIIRGLLDFSRQRKPDKTLCNLNEVIKGCISLLQDQALFHNIHFSMHLSSQPLMAIIDPSQIERVFINLIINAAEAMNGHGKLTITSRLDKNAQAIELIFTDTGPGIKKEDLGKIFDPFFTTKDTGHGVGLGLAITYGIIKEHQGTIIVKSDRNKGTTFNIRLPISEDLSGDKDKV
jgi:two-component system NtrC family sensor kinase